MTPPPAAGSRGGRPATAPDAQAELDRITAHYQDTRSTEFGDVCAWIVRTASDRGEYHGDDAAEWALVNRNALGLAVRHLTRNGIIEPTGEHRPSTARAAHGRRSYVYRLTTLGRRAAARWPKPAHVAKGTDPNDPTQAALTLAV